MSVPKRFRGTSRETWADALDAAAGVGLLTRLGGGMYRIHPALPAYLAAWWRTEEAADYDGQRAAATRALLSAYAVFGDWLCGRSVPVTPGSPTRSSGCNSARWATCSVRAGPAALGRGASDRPAA